MPLSLSIEGRPRSADDPLRTRVISDDADPISLPE